MNHGYWLWVKISASLKFAKGVISFFLLLYAKCNKSCQDTSLVVNHFEFQETLNLRVHFNSTNSFANKEPTSDSCVSISKKIVLSQLFTMHCFMVLKGVLLSANQKNTMAYSQRNMSPYYLYIRVLVLFPRS